MFPSHREPKDPKSKGQIQSSPDPNPLQVKSALGWTLQVLPRDKSRCGIFVTSVRFSKRFGTSTIPCCVCITGLMAEIFQLCAQPQAERM